MRSKSISIGIVAGILFSGCSVVFPYKNNFACSGGSEISYCENISDMYERVNDPEGEFAQDKKAKKPAKNKAKKADKQAENKYLVAENHKLKVAVKSLEAERLKSERKVILLQGDYLEEQKTTIRGIK